jgi:hypothetical protein
MRRFGILIVSVSAFVVALGVISGPAQAADPHYTDGSQCQGPYCPPAVPNNPPPTNPVFAPGQECKIDIVDPPAVDLVYMTEHFVYGTTPPPAGVVPVTDDASMTFPYHGVAPAEFPIDVTAFVAGKQGFRSDTWNIGAGVTLWVPFDCTNPPTTTTSSSTTTSSTSTSTTTTSIGGETSTTSSTTTTSIGPAGSTTTSVEPLGSTTTSLEPSGETSTTAAAASSSGSLPFTGGGGAAIPIALITLGAGVALVVGARRRRTAG